ncbi:riboflavin biosynthesis protein RibF [Lacticaseibacillus nasuensis]|uniref:Riboflavin biosynthesis protein n=1 Tax=Lacticaseibacillus nasuensis JCM 17158 TaxID=1291734 RepID=A0A0R1JST4_9LACO|nr:riboflavin biosynthesis protein RibF [Lacticaseibacillus nasuensis]KRK74368.1 FAD synthase [Lacticaseibacillus nasuensis JCM 17158]
MKVIDIQPPLQASQVSQQPIVLALGFFDGVHRGHQQVLAAARQAADARGLQLAAMTFDVHPAVIYRHVPAASVKYLTTPARKAELMAQFGVDLLYIVHFTPAFAALSPQAFVDDYLVGLNAAVVTAGFDYTYGKRAVANMDTLPQYAKGRFEIITVPALTAAEGKVSSSHIRAALDAGDIDAANADLGYRYRTTGIVVHGEARGRTLGFRTANIDTPSAERLPGIGIYAVRMLVNGQWVDGMASVGRNVTFGANRPVTLEINLFDFDADIYGAAVVVEWYHYLRGEVKFAGAQALVAQLHRDQANSQAYFKELS